jgi:ABC-type Fe3+ transport system substrate-binding protein
MNDGPSIKPAGIAVILLFVGACLAGAWWLFTQRAPKTNSADPQSQVTPPTGGKSVTVGVAYGSEKRKWMEWAADAFSRTPEGQGITLDLKPMGSLEGGQAILRGDTSIHLWSPASSQALAGFKTDWEIKQSGEPFLMNESLALTPMAFVWWKDRLEAFQAKYKTVTFKTIGQALDEKTGWAGIANKPEWGLFKFAHTHPSQSNSGQTTLVSYAYEFYGINRGLTLTQILDPQFQTWMQHFAVSVTGLSNSTGTLMKELVLKGPSAYDCIFVYESAAIDYLKSAEGRWGELRIVYPQQNLWNEHPAVVLNAPWSSPAQRAGAKAFVKFLLSEPAQQMALKHGLRPANPDVAVLTPDSPFTQYQRYGLRNDLGSTGEAPSPEVVLNLVQSWQRSQGGR